MNIKKNPNKVKEYPITFLASAAYKDKLKDAAEKKGLTTSGFIRMVINEYLEGGR